MPQCEARRRTTRRRLFEVVTATLLAVPILGPLAFAVYVAVRPRRPRGDTEQERLFPTLPIEDIPEQGARRFRVQYEQRRGPFRWTFEHVVFLRRQGDGVLALADDCTHLGCSVRYVEREAGDRYECPCHGGVFDLEGRVVAGPPPRPLMRYRTVVPEDRSEPVLLEVPVEQV